MMERQKAQGRKGMKILAAVVVIVIAAVLLGWLSMSYDDGEANINVDTEEVQRETREGAEKATEAVEESSRAVEEELRE